jgi:hypothetical protein
MLRIVEQNIAKYSLVLPSSKNYLPTTCPTTLKHDTRISHRNSHCFIITTKLIKSLNSVEILLLLSLKGVTTHTKMETINHNEKYQVHNWITLTCQMTRDDGLCHSMSYYLT